VLSGRKENSKEKEYLLDRIPVEGSGG